MRKSSVVEVIIYILVFAVIAWLVWSWFDVVSHNLENEVYSKYNAFSLFLRAMKMKR